MRRILLTIIILASLSLAKAQTLQDFSVGIGGGPNMYFGSIVDGERVGFSAYFETTYKIDNFYSLSLSYSNNHIQASRYADNTTTYYFNTALNSFDLHFEMNVLRIANLVPEEFPIRAFFDVGAGFSLINEGMYYGDAFPDKEDQESYVYKDSHGKSSSAKLHLGPAISYEITPEFSVTSTLLAHYYFTSDIDGYAHYANDPSRKTKNDVYYSWTFGVRYNLGNLDFNKDSDKPIGYRGRFFNRKTTEESYYENRYLTPQDTPERRWNGKKTKNSKSTSVERWKGKKSSDKKNSNTEQLKSF